MFFFSVAVIRLIISVKVHWGHKVIRDIYHNGHAIKTPMIFYRP